MIRIGKKIFALFPDIKIESERLVMRPPALRDFEQWAGVRGRCRDYLRPFEPLWSEDSLTRPHFMRRLERQSREWAIGHAHSFLIFTAAGQRLVGGMNINNICRGAAQYASLGYWIDEAEQGKGLMGEALGMTIRYAFQDLVLHRINASTLPHNARSRKLLLSAGFEEEGFAKNYLQINGLWQDHVLYGLPIERWRVQALPA
jgi:[ribosomal protein S5]-alanine N-acetyltransferase